MPRFFTPVMAGLLICSVMANSSFAVTSLFPAVPDSKQAACFAEEALVNRIAYGWSTWQHPHARFMNLTVSALGLSLIIQSDLGQLGRSPPPRPQRSQTSESKPGSELQEATRKWLNDLKSPAPAVRSAALRQIMARLLFEPPALVRQLIPASIRKDLQSLLLQDPDRDVRKAAADALKFFRDKRLISDRDKEFQHLMEAWDNFDYERPLLLRLSDSNTAIRWWASVELHSNLEEHSLLDLSFKQFLTPNDLAALEKSATPDNPDPALRANMAHLLGLPAEPLSDTVIKDIFTARIPFLTEQLREQSKRLYHHGNPNITVLQNIFVKLGPSAVSPLLGLMQDGDSTLRLHAAAILGDIHDPRAVEPMARAFLNEKAGLMESQLFTILVSLNRDAAGEALRLGVEHPDLSKRRSTFKLLLAHPDLLPADQRGALIQTMFEHAPMETFTSLWKNVGSNAVFTPASEIFQRELVAHWTFVQAYAESQPEFLSAVEKELAPEFGSDPRYQDLLFSLHHPAWDAATEKKVRDVQSSEDLKRSLLILSYYGATGENSWELLLQRSLGLAIKARDFNSVLWFAGLNQKTRPGVDNILQSIIPGLVQSAQGRISILRHAHLLLGMSQTWAAEAVRQAAQRDPVTALSGLSDWIDSPDSEELFLPMASQLLVVSPRSFINAIEKIPSPPAWLGPYSEGAHILEKLTIDSSADSLRLLRGLIAVLPQTSPAPNPALLLGIRDASRQVIAALDAVADSSDETRFASVKDADARSLYTVLVFANTDRIPSIFDGLLERLEARMQMESVTWGMLRTLHGETQFQILTQRLKERVLKISNVQQRTHIQQLIEDLKVSIPIARIPVIAPRFFNPFYRHSSTHHIPEDTAWEILFRAA